MSDNGDYVERTTTVEAPTTVRTEVVRTRSSAGWWVAALVAIVAIVGVIFLIGSQNNQADLQAARDAGAAQATLDSATASAQSAATQASQAAQSAVEGAAQASESAASTAADAAQNAAAATTDAAQGVTEPAPQ